MMQKLLIGLVKGYRLLLSPWLGSACRFEPTCSVYSLEALKQHGAGVGSYLTWALEEAPQKQASSLGYVPLQGEVLAKARAAIAKIRD